MGAFLALVPANAQAGCPNICELTVQSPVVLPPLSCVRLSAEGQECGCGVHLQVSNDCAASLEISSNDLYQCRAE